MTLEINTTRGIVLQVLHIVRLHIKNFQRYADSSLLGFDKIPLHCVVKTPRTDRTLLMTWIHLMFRTLNFKCRLCSTLLWHCMNRCLLEVSQRSARFVLPRRAHKNVYDRLCKIMDPLYRSAFCNGTQKEHMDIANSAKEIFCE